MFDNIIKFFKKFKRSEKEESKSTAKERLHLVLAQDRANISADFLEMMKQEILEVIKKYIDIDEKAIDVRLTNKENEDGGVGAPALYANIPIITIKNEARKLEGKSNNIIKKEQEEVQSGNQESNSEKVVEETENVEEANEELSDEVQEKSYENKRQNIESSLETDGEEENQALEDSKENNIASEVDNEEKNS